MAAPQPFTSALRRLAPAGMPSPVAGALGKLLRLGHLDALYAAAAAQPGPRFADRMLKCFEVSVVVADDDLARIPARGPVVVAANHPFGLLEGIAALALLDRVRPDVKFLASHLLGTVPELRERLILVDPSGAADARRANPGALREALAWLDGGGMLVVFPAGEVAHLDPRRIGIEDPAWHATAVRLMRRTGAAAAPLYFAGKNSALFQVAGLVHPGLRTALLPHELWNKRGGRVEVRIGHPVPVRRLAEDASAATEQLRRRVYWLGRRTAAAARPRAVEPVAAPVPAGWLAEEIDALPRDRLLAAQGPWQVWQVMEREAPMVVRETGRLREVAFRAAGEGTGRAADIDRFDSIYTHLVLWHSLERRAGGAYRVCKSDLPGRDLYTRSLFRFKPGFWERLGPALELGRSFVALQDQRSFQALYLLWRAIGEYVVRNPRYLTLFGPVSVSSQYQPASRALIAQWLRREAFDRRLGALVAPRRPYFAPKAGFRLPPARGIDELDAYLRDIEPDGKGVPVLVRQYLRMGGRIAALHVDQAFNGTLDALVAVDLRRSGRKALTRYFGAGRVESLLGAGPG